MACEGSKAHTTTRSSLLRRRLDPRTLDWDAEVVPWLGQDVGVARPLVVRRPRHPVRDGPWCDLRGRAVPCLQCCTFPRHPRARHRADTRGAHPLRALSLDTA